MGTHKRFRPGVGVAGLYLILLLLSGCGGEGDKSAAAKPVMAPAPAWGDKADGPAEGASPLPAAGAAAQEAKGAKATGKSSGEGLAVEVDGVKLTQAKLNRDLDARIAEFKGKVAGEQLQKAKGEIRKALIEEFIVRTLLDNELQKRKITASEKEINEVLDAMKTQLPPGVTMEQLLKSNQIDLAKMREEIAANIRINALILQELGGKVTVTDKETADFYNQNLDKFKQPESVHARHLLIAFAEGDSEKIKADKKAKAETLRKKLLEGADFAELAAKNSDCPSKQNGGDLGTFTRGQMVKAFEDAAFGQAKMAIGPVVETEFGFHLIQVLEHRAEQTTKLDKDTRKQITAFLETQKQEAAFQGLLKKIKAKADIVVYGK